VEHCTEGFLIRDVLAEKKIPAVAGPHLGGRSKPETSRRHLGNVGLLHEAGVKVALQTDAGSAAQFLPVHAAVAVREGLPADAALRSITLTPAEILGVADRMGSIDPGKDADLVVIPGEPLDARLKPSHVFVDGKLEVEPGGRNDR
jgi:imidazolonepropionase-like amidohydrolase